jgi:hypothetical protein
MAPREDALFGPDGTSGDGVGPLPGLDLPVVRLPTIGLDGSVTGLDALDDDLDSGSAGPASSAAPAPTPPVVPSMPVPPMPGPPPTGLRPPDAPARRAAPDTAPVPGAPQTPSPPAPAEPATSAGPAGRPARPRAVPARTEPVRPGSPAARAPVYGRREHLPTRPRIEQEPSILGLSRHSRSRIGSRAFTLFFVFVFALILVQLVVTLLSG